MSPLLTQPRSATVQPHLDKAIVAELTPYQISELTSDEMVQAIRTASIPPETILLSLAPVDTSARNTHQGQINAIRERNGTVEIVVDVGEALVVRLTRRSYLEMDLKLGMGVYLVFKAEAVKLY